MLLHVGYVVGYNNLIIIATEAQTLGRNSSLNIIVAPPNATNDTGERGLVEPSQPQHDKVTTNMAAASLPAMTTIMTTSPSTKHHEDEKNQPWLWAALPLDY